MLVKQVRMSKVLRGVIEPPVSVFEGFVNRLGGEVITFFRAGLNKAYIKNMVDCSVGLNHFSDAGATFVFWWLDSEGEVESGPSASKERHTVLAAGIIVVATVERVGDAVCLLCPIKIVFLCWFACCQNIVPFSLLGSLLNFGSVIKLSDNLF